MFSLFPSAFKLITAALAAAFRLVYAGYVVGVALLVFAGMPGGIRLFLSKKQAQESCAIM